LVGRNDGNVNSSYWDTQVSNQTAGAGTNNGTFNGTGLTTAQSLKQSSYVGWDFGPNGTWSIVDGQTRPSFLTSVQPPVQPPQPHTTTTPRPPLTPFPPLTDRVPPPSPTPNTTTPILITLTTGSPAPSGAGGNDGNGNGGAKPNYGPPPGPGLGRTLDEQQ